MSVRKRERKIAWYRSPLDRETMAAVNQRSDAKGLLQTLGHLGLLVLTGAAAFYVKGRYPWPVLLLVLFVHGTFYAFLLNAFHELCHKTVFKTRSLNTFFLNLISFISWHNPVLFWASHQEHHKFTLHPPDDLEVVLPQKLTLTSFLQSAVVNPWDLLGRIKTYIRWSLGRLEGEWETYLFTQLSPHLKPDLVRWARTVLAGHALLVIVSLALGLWLIPVLVTLAPFYGGWLLYLLNNTQHTGLVDNTPDYRLCTRTITLNPFLEFLYWHMNFHVEHHMYAAVPCYNLSKVHQQIKADLPACPNGIIATWKHLIPILQRQKADPTYQYVANLPSPGRV